MDSAIFFHGFLLSTALMAIEHLLLYRRLKPCGDAHDEWRVLLKFALGVLAILAGCALVAWETRDALALFAPIASSLAGAVIAALYLGRWIYGRMREAAYTRGWLMGLADKGDVHEDG